MRMPITHRSVLTIAMPIMLSNVTEPLIGVVNTAIIGQLPEAYYIGAIAVGLADLLLPLLGLWLSSAVDRRTFGPGHGCGRQR